MDTADTIKILRSRIRSTATLIRDSGEKIQASITRVIGEGDDTICTFMDVMEGVERTLSVSEIEDIKVD